MKLFKRLLDLLNIHPDENQRWTLSTLFIVGLLDAYVEPAISKAWVTELPAEWLAFQSLFYSVVGLFIGMIWKGWVRRKAIQWFTVLCIIEQASASACGSASWSTTCGCWPSPACSTARWCRSSSASV